MLNPPLSSPPPTLAAFFSFSWMEYLQCKQTRSVGRGLLSKRAHQFSGAASLPVLLRPPPRRAVSRAVSSLLWRFLLQAARIGTAAHLEAPPRRAVLRCPQRSVKEGNAVARSYVLYSVFACAFCLCLGIHGWGEKNVLWCRTERASSQLSAWCRSRCCETPFWSHLELITSALLASRWEQCFTPHQMDDNTVF